MWLSTEEAVSSLDEKTVIRKRLQQIKIKPKSFIQMLKEHAERRRSLAGSDEDYFPDDPEDSATRERLKRWVQSF